MHLVYFVKFIYLTVPGLRASQVALVVKEPTCKYRRHKRYRFNPWVESVATHFILAWGIPWAEEPGGLQSIALHRVGHD